MIDELTQPMQRVSELPRRRGCFGCFSRAFFVGVLVVGMLVFVVSVAAGTLGYAQLSKEIEQGVTTLDTARDRETFETTVIMDRNGEVLWEIFGEGKRTFVPLADIPPTVQFATIAIEDDTFYENIGLDAPSLVAALIANLRNPDSRPVGGSTITQQIVRHIAFDYEERTAVSYERKAKEVLLARLMTERYTKDEILELYLNEIYYGNLAYGIEAASQTYFGKSATELNLSEATLLSALPQSPVDLDPLTNFEGAKERQWIVLFLMADEGYISLEQAETAYQEPLAFVAQEVSLDAPHFAVYVRQLLEEQFGADVVANGGLRVTTTLDMRYQRLAENLARQHVAAVGAEHNLTNASLVAMKPGTGEILAMLGSLDYRDERIDGFVNVATSLQQPGSSIKPLTYAAALSPDPTTGAVGWTAADILWDVPVDYGQTNGVVYSPLNYDRRFHGPVRLRDGLANSFNVPAVLVLQDIGVPQFLSFSQRMGIESFGDDASQYGLSITLGGAELTPLELTSAYGVFANGGARLPETAILEVTKRDGTVLFSHVAPEPVQVLDARVAFLISDMLDDDGARVPAMGRNNPLDVGFPAGVKTGTTNDFRDNWTVGFTPSLVVGVWTGNTDNSEMIDISGLTGAAPLWADYMQAVFGNVELHDALLVDGVQRPEGFTPPAGIERRPICELSSVTLGATACSLSDSEWFLVEGGDEGGVVPAGEPAVEWEQLDPAVWRVPAVELLGATVSEDGEEPTPSFCYFSEGVLIAELPPEALTGLFLTPPRNPESQEPAYEWAEEHDLPILPQEACTEALLALAGRDPHQLAIWRIASPAEGDVISEIIAIVGTADFDPSQVQFYKVEIGAGENPTDWITLGEVSHTPVVNGQLERLVAPAFEPGIYTLRLIVVLWDGNYVGEPYEVTFVIE